MENLRLALDENQHITDSQVVAMSREIFQQVRTLLEAVAATPLEASLISYELQQAVDDAANAYKLLSRRS